MNHPLVPGIATESLLATYYRVSPRETTSSSRLPSCRRRSVGVRKPGRPTFVSRLSAASPRATYTSRHESRGDADLGGRLGARGPATGRGRRIASHGKRKLWRDTQRAMSEENVEMVRRWVEAINRGDADELVELADQSID